MVKELYSLTYEGIKMADDPLEKCARDMDRHSTKRDIFKFTNKHIRICLLRFTDDIHNTWGNLD